MKISYFLILLLLPFCGYTQTVSVDDSESNPLSLADFLFDTGCVQLSNASFSSQESVATFTNNGGNFPLSEGIIIRSGKASFSEGPYTGNNLSSQENDDSDPALQAISNASGQTSTITDVAYLEFDFTPISTNFTFNFLFASNEYGEWQCSSTDAFAFLLTNLETNETTNLAVIPNSTTPVSVNNIRDNTYNATCNSQNPSLFGGYNVDDPGNSTINMRGYTTVMNASSPIEPGTQYRIRLVIGDSNDANFDSAIFLESESFDTSIDLGPDRTICDGDNTIIETGLDPTEYTHTWKRNGQVIANENDASLEVTTSGTYRIEVTRNGSNCAVSDEIVFDELLVDPPQDVFACNNGTNTSSFNLTENNANALGIDPDVYNVVYYSSPFAAEANFPIDSGQLTDYTSTGGQTIYIKLLNTETGNFCDAVYTFDLNINAEIEAFPPDPIEVCKSSSYDIDLTQVANDVLGTQDANDFNVTYYPQENGGLPIINPGNYSPSSGFGTQTIWVRVQDPDNPGCYAAVGLDIIEHPNPPIDVLPDVIVCTEYVLPPIEDGEYFSGSQGSGEQFDPGDVITEEGYYRIFNGPDENGCTRQSTFEVTMLDNYDISGTYCDHFTVPEPPVGSFYTEVDGPNGTGDLIPTGTVLTSDQDIYYYAEIDGDLCRNEAFTIDIHPLPPVDNPDDVVACDDYTLPALQDGNYFGGEDGGGTAYSAGDVITSSMELYVFADDGTCTNQSTFEITIMPDFSDETTCGSYTLPELEAGEYYTQPEGQGTQLSAGTDITSSQTIYVYVQTTQTPNCTDNLSFDITILPLPPVDSLDDVFLCEGDTYTLPVLTDGAYFTETDEGGTQLYAGDVITDTQDIYIYSENSYCSNETTFTVTVNPYPPIANFTDVYSCEPYAIPEPQNGDIYTEPNGGGDLIQPGELIGSTQTLYIYNQSDEPPYCEIEQEFTVYVYIVEDVGELEDVAACDSYTLPELSAGNYYTEAGGQGQQILPGTVIETSQTLFAYAQAGGRFCESETEFDVIISETPELPEFDDITRCGSYTLPSLDNLEANASYYWEPQGQSPIGEDDQTLDEPGTYTIYVHAAADDNPDCFDEKKFDVTINPLREMQIEDGIICVDAESNEPLNSVYLESGVDPSIFEIDWYLDGELVHTGPDYEATQSGEYVVETTKSTPNDGTQCTYKPAVVNVQESSQPVIKAHLSEDFSTNPSIRVEIVQGSDDYTYQLDDGPFQSDNVFLNVESGIHTVTVKDALGACGETTIEVQVLKFPKYFTPNNDGQNDRWNIKDLANHPEAKIHIFDRYGKLLATIYPYSLGWDGQYNGKNKPSDDYWFKVEYTAEGQKRQYTSHFSLMR